jgi:(p)ppGpp synthase/HD superfamily hydrolase
LTLVERDGRTRSFHVPRVTARTLRPIIVKTADRASHLMTDGARMYPKAGKEFASHSSVDHAAGEYVRMGFHHSNRYLAEFDFRYSHRSGLGVDDEIRTNEVLRNIGGKRLTYRRSNEAKVA